MKHFVNCSPDQSPVTTAEFRIGVRSAPYLADHGFQDMIVLPGSFYVDVALCVNREPSKRVPVLVRNVAFHNPIILSGEEPVIRVEARNQGDGRVEYAFYENGAEAGGDRSPARRCIANLEIERNSSNSSISAFDAFSIKAFQAQSRVVMDSGEFYGKLRENGNQYGPGFQNISMIWRAGDQSLGKISLSHHHREAKPHCLHPSLLDSLTQMLAPFVVEKGKTFILRSIDKIEVMDVNFPDTLWAHATRLPEPDGGDKGLLGSVRVFDQSCKPYLELSGVAFSFLDRVGVSEEKPVANLVIAANFTAEPLEDSLKFWGGHFDIPIHAEFAPYNQIFQQLLDPGSRFRRNRDGANIVLVQLEEWASKRPPELGPLNKERLNSSFGDRQRYLLPNGVEIVHLNQYETDYVYKEVFEDECYLRHGIRLRDGATVVDIGANIGLFSLFVMSRCANPKIYAFEPAPVVYDLLTANCDAYGTNVRALNLGVSDRPKTATFTFYEQSSVFSGFHSNETEDREAIQTVVRNVLKHGCVAGESVDDYVNELTADRLRRRTQECQLTAVSEIIRDNQIDKIDLLKIDAEKSELDIIQGIDESDWQKIEQIVIEIHDRTGEVVRKIKDLLIQRGYRCAVEEEKLLEHSGLFNLYATRRANDRETHSDSGNFEAVATRTGQAVQAASDLERKIQDFTAALRAFMNQTAVPLVLCFCPRIPAAEADAALSAVLNDAEERLLTEAGTMSNVRTISSASLLQHYPINSYYDPHSHQAGHIPYTSECYAAIGTMLFRTLFNLNSNPFKVIVLDCDNTLWRGVCGEDGPSGVEVAAPYRALQEFMIGQMKAGMLISLCSKNNEKDVLDVFDQRTDMLLKREHLVSWRINWSNKSENIKSLANELNLGLESFIFVDDNPVDCADVKINCPGALTLQLPRNAALFPVFLKHIWAFDRVGATEEDQNRTRLYRENSERHQFLERSFSLKDFVEGLQLRVEIEEATEDQLGRVSQLTFRTNQFNFTTIRRSEGEIKDFLKRKGAHCRAVRVVDRFGDYGLVGVLMYEAEDDRYKVDTFLLSCRVLGRGVEHALVSDLGRRAVKEGKKFVELTCLPTQKNQPALEFITSFGDQYRNAEGNAWTFPAECLASVQYNPDGKSPKRQGVATVQDSGKLTPRTALGFGVLNRSERLQPIAERLCDMGRLSRAIEEFRLGKQPLVPAADAASGNTLEIALLNIWRRVLGRPRIGLNDNFFEAGGTSLRAVQVIATVKKELKQNLSIVHLFECPTVTLLAAKLSPKPAEPRTGTAPAGATLRGQRRRNKIVRQAVS